MLRGAVSADGRPPVPGRGRARTPARQAGPGHQVARRYAPCRPNSPMTEQTRREFCTQACQMASAAALAGSMGALLQGCGGGGGSVTGGSLPSDVPALATLSATAASGGVTLNVDAGSPLSAVGGAALLQSSSGLLLVAHTGPDTVTALTPTCTHENCTITGFTGQGYL